MCRRAVEARALAGHFEILLVFLAPLNVSIFRVADIYICNVSIRLLGTILVEVCTYDCIAPT